MKIQNDNMPAAEFKTFLESAFKSYRHLMKTGASLYVCHSSSWQREFQDALEAAGFEIRCQVIWAKNTFAWGQSEVPTFGVSEIIMSTLIKIQDKGQVTIPNRSAFVPNAGSARQRAVAFPSARLSQQALREIRSLDFLYTGEDLAAHK